AVDTAVGAPLLIDQLRTHQPTCCQRLQRRVDLATAGVPVSGQRAVEGAVDVVARHRARAQEAQHDRAQCVARRISLALSVGGISLFDWFACHLDVTSKEHYFHKIIAPDGDSYPRWTAWRCDDAGSGKWYEPAFRGRLIRLSDTCAIHERAEHYAASLELWLGGVSWWLGIGCSLGSPSSSSLTTLKARSISTRRLARWRRSVSHSLSISAVSARRRGPLAGARMGWAADFA